MIPVQSPIVMYGLCEPRMRGDDPLVELRRVPEFA